MAASKAARRTRTLWLFYIRQVSFGMVVYQPTFVPFLLARGLNMIDVAMLFTVYNLGVLFLDIPTGYFADRFGRKWALAASNGAIAFGTVILALGHSMSAFIVAELFFALGIAMDAGTQSAYLFEWLREQGKENKYYHYDAMGMFLFLGFGAVGTFVAGYCAEVDIALPVYLTAGLTAIGAPAAMLLPKLSKTEDRRVLGFKVRATKPHHLSDLWKMTGNILSTPGLRWAVGVTILLFWAKQFINFQIAAPYFASLHFKLHTYGILFAALTFGGGLIAFFSRKIIQKPDLLMPTLVGLALVPMSFGVMGFFQNYYSLFGYFVFAIPYGLCTAVSNTLLNRQYGDHEKRATFLSVVDTFVRLISSALTLYLGKVLAQKGSSATLIDAFIFSGLLAVILLPGTFKYSKK